MAVFRHRSIEICFYFSWIATGFCIDFTVIDLFLSQQAGDRLDSTRIVSEISYNRVGYSLNGALIRQRRMKSHSLFSLVADKFGRD
jgi:hypothetical protein